MKTPDQKLDDKIAFVNQEEKRLRNMVNMRQKQCDEITKKEKEAADHQSRLSVEIGEMTVELSELKKTLSDVQEKLKSAISREHHAKKNADTMISEAQAIAADAEKFKLQAKADAEAAASKLDLAKKRMDAVMSEEKRLEKEKEGVSGLAKKVESERFEARDILQKAHAKATEIMDKIHSELEEAKLKNEQSGVRARESERSYREAQSKKEEAARFLAGAHEKSKDLNLKIDAIEKMREKLVLREKSVSEKEGALAKQFQKARAMSDEIKVRMRKLLDREKSVSIREEGVKMGILGPQK